MIDEFLPAVNSLLASIWALEPGRFEALAADLSDIRAGKKGGGGPAGKSALEVSDGVARIPVTGILLKSREMWLDFFGIAQTGYDEIRSALAEAVARPDVTAIELRVDSPGGTVAGGEETAAAIRQARASKPVTAVVQDLCASGAYWLASQAGHISANENAQIGSIGVYAVAVDWSKYADELGAKVNIIRSGEHKGVGVMGAEITKSHLAALQMIIDGLADHFINAVASGRRMTKAAAADLATGQTWLAAEAKGLGLIDEVATGAAAEAMTTDTGTEAKGDVMGAETKTATAEAQAELTARIAGLEKENADLKAGVADFTKQLATGQEAGTKLMALVETLTAAKAGLETANAALEARVKVLAAGAAPVAGGTEGGGKPDFMARAKEIAAEKKILLSEAMKMVARQEPELHAAYLASLRK
jgi:signal peptide peptidase SppA